MTRAEIRIIHSPDSFRQITADSTLDHHEMIDLVSRFFFHEDRSGSVYSRSMNHLILNKLKKRPIYLLSELNGEIHSSKRSQFISNGLVFQLAVTADYKTEPINWAALNRVLLEPDFFQKIQSSDTVTNNSVKEIRMLYTDLAYLLFEFISEQNPENETEIKFFITGWTDFTRDRAGFPNFE